jgi:2-polyprenyl-3-methyl-5-hydroxy-6-metoxy-1,4-benzoquinol methylase
MNAVPCLVCGGICRPSDTPALLTCGTCSFITTNIELSREEVKRLYSANYFAGEEYKDYLAERPLIEAHFRSRLKKLEKYAGDLSAKRLFEIGCAYGFFLAVARDRCASVEGIDISLDAVTYASQTLGLPVHAVDFLDYEFHQNADVVCLWDTIEHLQSPHLYIEKAAAHMNPRGILALTTGDIGSLMARWRGARWRQIHPPTHLHYFSKATLTRLLQKYGFSIRYFGYEGMYRSLDTMAYIVLMLKRHRPRLYTALQRTGLLKHTLYLNLFDIMFVIAEKSER